MSEEIFRVEIDNPLEFIETGKGVRKKKKKHYLNANIFYAGVHEQVRMQIVDECKKFLLPYFTSCPQLTNAPYSTVIQYCSPKTNFDLDGKAFFWRKIILDILGERTKRDNVEAIKLGKIKDDSVIYFDCNGEEYYKTTDTCLIFLILKN